MPMVFENNAWVLRCASCGTLNPQAWQQMGDKEGCSSCGRIVDNSPRDAFGNKVNVPAEHLGKYSYAIDGVINSSRGYADYLKRNNLVLRNS